MTDYTWYAMPEQQHQYGRGSDPGRGGTGPSGRDPGWDAPGGQWGGTGPDPSRTAARERERQAQASRQRTQSRALSRMMSAQHRNRAARGYVDPDTGLSALTGMEMDRERDVQETMIERKGLLAGLVGSLIGAAVGLPGLGFFGKKMATSKKDEKVAARMAEYEQTGLMTDPGPLGMGPAGPTDFSQRGEGSDPREPVKAKKEEPGGPADPEPEEELDEYDEFWLTEFGINPNDPRLQDPSFDPGKPGTPAASQQMQRQNLQGPGGNPTLAYMQMVNRDIRRGRQQHAAMNRERGRMRLGGPQ